MNATVAAQKRAVISLEQEALVNLKSAEAELATASGKLQAFVEENFRMVAGGLIYISSRFNHEELNAELHAQTVAVDEARMKFHTALAKWAQYR
jgi:superfamily II DNA helicase RecQ